MPPLRKAPALAESKRVAHSLLQPFVELALQCLQIVVRDLVVLRFPVAPDSRACRPEARHILRAACGAGRGKSSRAGNEVQEHIVEDALQIDLGSRIEAPGDKASRRAEHDAVVHLPVRERRDAHPVDCEQRRSSAINQQHERERATQRFEHGFTGRAIVLQDASRESHLPDGVRSEPPRPAQRARTVAPSSCRISQWPPAAAKPP